MKILLDTHSFLWAVSKPGLLSPKAKTLIFNPDVTEILLSSISIWELSMLHSKRRIDLPTDARKWFAQALSFHKIRVVEISPEIALDASNLPGQPHSDPADQIIVATARAERATLITKDKKILNYPHVETLW
jgi:PIN domain nuclease of toxin-antitoxin system